MFSGNNMLFIFVRTGSKSIDNNDISLYLHSHFLFLSSCWLQKNVNSHFNIMSNNIICLFQIYIETNNFM